MIQISREDGSCPVCTLVQFAVMLHVGHLIEDSSSACSTAMELKHALDGVLEL